MPSEPTVISYHLNIGEGDSAIHLLLDKNRRVESAVLIDGGFGNNGAELIPDFMRSPEFKQWKRSAGQHRGEPVSYFDAVVVTHWDDDHAAGVSALLKQNIEAAAQDYIDENNIKTPEQFERAAAGGEIKGSLINFETRRRQNKYWPVTRLYCPYWIPSRSKLYNNPKWNQTLHKRHTDGLRRMEKADGKTDFVSFQITYELPDNTQHDVEVTALLLGQMSQNLIGIDIFTGESVIESHKAEYPSTISSAMATTGQWKEKPAMVCIGCDGVICNSKETKNRSEMVWKDTSTSDLRYMNFHELRLAHPGITSATHTDESHSDLSAQAVYGTTTGNNLASIACMIFWPDSGRENVSHYFAGDLGDEIEEDIIRWATYEDPTTRVRKPIKVRSMKLSHHGSKFSTPLLMLFGWKPYYIVSPSGMNSQFNHCSWEILILIWGWTIWSQKQKFLSTQALCTTNYPIYLVRYWLGKQRRPVFIQPGSIKSLWNIPGKDFRDVMKNLRWKHMYSDVPDLPSPKTDEDDERAKRTVTAWLAKSWPLISLVNEIYYFGTAATNINEGFCESEKQTLRVIRIAQTKDESQCAWFQSPTMKGVIARGLPTNWSTLERSNTPLPTGIEEEVGNPCNFENPPRIPGRSETQGDPLHDNRSRCARGAFVSEKSFKCLLRDSGWDEKTANHDNPNDDKRDSRTTARFTAMPPFRIRSSIDSLFFVVASDATIVSQPEGGIHRVEEGHLDWFLGDLHTGAMVFASAPPSAGISPATMTELHKTDDVSMYLMKCMGSDTDDGCGMGAATYVGSNGLVKINGFQLQTKLQYTSKKPNLPNSKFFTTPVIFSSFNNAYDFDLTSTNWPNSSTTDPVSDAVSPAHVICMSLGEKASISNQRISGADILDFLDLLPRGTLRLLASLSAFRLDTEGRGRKNAVWFSPNRYYETSLRLCFNHDDSSVSSLLDTVHTFLADITGIKAKDIAVKRSNLVAKKTWTRYGTAKLKVVGEVTLYTNVEITNRSPAGSSKDVTILFETALILSEKKTEWILNFPTGDPEHPPPSLEALTDFVSGVFTRTDFPNVGRYLPGASRIVMRRLTFTSSVDDAGVVDRRSVKIIMQATFAGMTVICSFDFDLTASGGKPTFSLSGSIFPENRPAKMGEDFLWIPYMPRYEPWTAFEIMPTLNTVGVLEDVDGSDVGNLKQVYNALSSGSKGTLEASPMGLELLGLTFSLTRSEVVFNAMITSETPANDVVPPLKLLGANVDLRYDCDKGGVSNCGITASLAMISPDTRINPAIWKLTLRYDHPTWTLSGGVSSLRGSLLYSLFNKDCNQEMMQLLSDIIFDLHLTYYYDSRAKGFKFIAKGSLYLGHLELDATYKHDGDKEWSLLADLKINASSTSKHVLRGKEEIKGGTLAKVVGSICGAEVVSILPECVANITINPLNNKKLTSLIVVRLTGAIIILVRLQITESTCVAFYQYQALRDSEADNKAKAPATKRLLIFSVPSLPKVPGIPMVGSISQPFDELRFLWVSGDAGWTGKEVEAVHEALDMQTDPEGYPRISFKVIKRPKEGIANENKRAKAEDSAPVLKAGGHFCLLEGGETRLDYAFGGQGKKTGETPSATSGDPELVPMSATTPVNKTFGPIKILGVGIGFDVTKQTLKLALDGTVELGPMELTLLGFSISFSLKGATLMDFSKMKLPTFRLDGLGVTFQKDPLSISGLFEHKIVGEGTPEQSDMYLGGAIVGFKKWMLEAGGYYGSTTKHSPNIALSPNEILITAEEFKAFLAYVRVAGPIATIGYAEIRNVVGGFGYNTSIRTPNMQNIMDFPFLSAEPKKLPGDALASMLSGGWFANQEGHNWVAAGLTVLAFETLIIRAVVMVEWGSGTRLDIFGIADAAMPKKADKKFAVVQLGIVAMIDFDAGTLKVDGQLTPASFILDPSCHLTGGFALYSWFGPGESQGDWVFTIGGYHAAYKTPSQYPNPPRLGISWRFNQYINISGQAYFAITPKMCMGGGSLHVTLSLGPLYAHLDAYADFLINYRPFMYIAQGGVGVGVHYVLDLWLVTVPIRVDISAIITLRGPPLSGTVYVDFYVFGFEIKFGSTSTLINKPIPLSEFYSLVLQTAPKADEKSTMALRDLTDTLDGPSASTADSIAPAPHLLNCISGLVPQTKSTEMQGSENMWLVRGAVFAFNVSCKFAIKTIKVKTLSTAPNCAPDELVQAEVDIENKAQGTVYAKPMQRMSPLGQSHLELAIEPPQRPTGRHLRPSTIAINRDWVKFETQYSNLPTALWGHYDPNQDPAESNCDKSSLLNGNDGGMTQLLTGVTLYAPEGQRADGHLASFDVRTATGEVAAIVDFPVAQSYNREWFPAQRKETPDEQYAYVKDAWEKTRKNVNKAAKFMASLGLGGWEWDDAKRGDVGVPERLVDVEGELKRWFVEAPVVSCA